MNLNIILLGTVLILSAGCSEATYEPNSVGAKQTNSSAPSVTLNDDHGSIVAACMKFETAKVCKCIARTLEDELGPVSFKKVTENIRTGALTPSEWQQGMSSAEQSKFASAMESWNANCELN